MSSMGQDPGLIVRIKSSLVSPCLCFLGQCSVTTPSLSCSAFPTSTMMDCVPLNQESEINPFPLCCFVRYFVYHRCHRYRVQCSQKWSCLNAPLQSGNSGSKGMSHFQGESMLEAELLLKPSTKGSKHEVGCGAQDLENSFCCFLGDMQRDLQLACLLFLFM